MEATAPQLSSGLIKKAVAGAALDILVFVLFAFVLSMASLFSATVLLALVTGLNGDALKDSPHFLSVVLSSVFLGFLAASLSTYAVRGGSLKANVPMPKRAAMVLLVVLSALLAQGGAMLLLRLAEQFRMTLTGSNIEPIGAMLDQAPIVTYIMVVCIAPIAEELFFRHILLRRLVQHGFRKTGLIVSSLGFGIIHEISSGTSGLFEWLSLVLIYSAVGWVFAQVYLRTGRLWASVACHGLSNAAALIWLAMS